jgi:hypothetical protein
MPKYMINILYRAPEAQKRAPYTADIMEKYGRWSQAIAAQKIVAHKLKDGEGRVLRNDGARVVDGPYVETKEGIGGFYLVEARDYDHAVELASGCPSLSLEGGQVEVRAVEI